MKYDLLFYAIILVYALIGVAWGMWRGLMKSRIRVICTAISLIAAIAVTMIAKGMLGGLSLVDLVGKLGADTAALQELTEISPSLNTVLVSTAGAIVSPLVFLISFLLLAEVTYLIATLIFRGMIVGSKGAQVPYGKTRTILLSVLQCLLVVFVIMIPIGTYVELISPAVEELVSGDILEGDAKQQVIDLNENNIKPINESSSVNIFRAIGGRGIGHMMTDFKVNDVSVNLSEEMGSIVSFASKVVALGDTKIEEYSSKQVALIDGLADSFEGSVLLPTIGGEIIYSATDAWIKGEEFLGSPRMDMGDAIDPVFVRLLTIVNGDALKIEYLQEDIHTVADFIGVLAAHEVFATLSNTDDLMVQLGSNGVVKELITELGKNERMKALIPEITNMGMRAIATTLNIPDDVDGVYNEFLTDVAGMLNETNGLPMEERVQAVSAQLEEAFDEAGVAIDSELIDGYTTALLTDFEGETEITNESISEFFTVYAIAAADDIISDPDAMACVVIKDADSFSFKTAKYRGKTIDELLEQSGAACLANVTTQLMAIEESDPETFRMVATQILQNGFTPALVAHPKGEALMVAVRNIEITTPVSADLLGNTSSLQSASQMKTTVITLQDLLVDPDAAAAQITLETLASEAESIDAIFSSAIELKDVFDANENADISEIATSVGGILDSLAGANTFGQDKTATLFTAVMQSPTVRETANLKLSEATTLAGKATEGTPDYTKTMNAVATGVNIANSIGSDEMASEEEIRKLIDNMTPQTAAMLQTYVTPTRMVGYGIPEENSEISAELLGNMFEYMSHDLPDYEAEAKAISHLLNIATAARTAKGDRMFGEKLPEADELLNIIMASDAVCNSLVTTLTDGQVLVNRDPFGVADQIDEDSQDMIDLTEAIDNYRDSHPITAQTDLRLMAFGALFGLEVSF